MRNQNKKQAFTLVELIVVITILAILGTIGFISMSSYSELSRDSARISDIGGIKTGLELFMVDSGKYPPPTNGVDITYLSGIVWTQGTYGEQTNANVDKLSKLPLDPLTENKYTYSLTSRGNEYEISGIVEGDLAYSPHPNPLPRGEGIAALLNQTNAREIKAKAIVTGTYNGKITKTTDGTMCSLLAVPTIIVSDTTEYTDLVQLSANKKFVFNGYNNLPSSYKGSKFNNNGGFDFEPNELLLYSDYLGCSILENNETERITVLKKLQESYSGTLLETEGNYKELLNVNIDLFSPNNTSKLISRSIMTNNLGLRLSGDSFTYLNCESGEVNGYTYEDIAHGLGKNVTKTGAITYGTQNYGAQAICDNGVVTIKNESINTICNNGYVEQAGQCVADICNGTIPINGISTAITQSVSTSWTHNSTTPGQCTFKCDTNYVYNSGTNTCNAGTQNTNCTLLPANAIWNTTNNITQTWNGTNWLPLEIGSYNPTASTTTCNFKCEINYTWNGSECIADTQTTTCNGTIPTNSTATTASTYSQTWNGTTWIPTTNWGENQTECDFDCNTNYTWNGTTSQCEANTQTAQACTGKPSNSVYNTATSITQTWNGTIWTPSTTSTYNATPSTTSCRYKCDTNYTWNTSICEADTQSTTCGGSVPTNATATTATTYTQLWNGSSWTPTTSWGEFQSTCDFDCNANYTWNGTSCEANNYTVTFDGQGGIGHTPTTKSVTYNTAVGALPTNPTRTGYTFNGWFTATTGGTQITTSTTVLGTATVYAQWSINNYTVTFDGNGGTGHTPTTKSVTYNTAVGTLPTNPTRTGYTFNGWFTATSGGTQITTSTTVIGTATVYAQWSINSYTVTFNANGGTASTPATKAVNYNTAIGTLSTTTRTGYTFDGWFTATTGGTEITTATVVTANVTYYAQWIQNGVCGTAESTATTTAPAANLCTVGTASAVTTNAGTFTWTCSVSGASTDSCSATRQYTVTFNANGGVASTPVTKVVNYNTAIGTLSTTTRAGYTFDGWFTATTGGTEIITTTVVTANVTYYAQWIQNGVCGTAESIATTIAPTANLCTVGTASAVTTNAGTFTWTCAVSGASTDSCSATRQYTVSGGFGLNANGATINVCGTNLIADTNGNFTSTRNYGSTCNAITATRTGYICNTTINGPASLISNTTNITGTCVQQWSGDLTTGYLFKNISGVTQYPLSCNDLLVKTTWKNTYIGSPWNGTKFANGVYWIKPDLNAAFKVYCDMTTDGGGWTWIIKKKVEWNSWDPAIDSGLYTDNNYSIWSKNDIIPKTEIAIFDKFNGRIKKNVGALGFGNPTYSQYRGLYIRVDSTNGTGGGGTWCGTNSGIWGITGGDASGCHFNSLNFYWTDNVNESNPHELNDVQTLPTNVDYLIYMTR